LHRLDDLHVTGAATDVAAERLADVGLARVRIAPQQSRRCHDESGCAIAALRAELLVEPALHRRKPPIMPQRFDGIDALAANTRGQRQARQPRLIVDQHGARAAFAAITPRLCSSEPYDFPQIIQQQHIVRDRINARATIERQFEQACHISSNMNVVRYERVVPYQHSAQRSNRVSRVSAQGHTRTRIST
jgi:hypothetical protein